MVSDVNNTAQGVGKGVFKPSGVEIFVFISAPFLPPKGTYSLWSQFRAHPGREGADMVGIINYGAVTDNLARAPDLPQFRRAISPPYRLTMRGIKELHDFRPEIC